MQRILHCLRRDGSRRARVSWLCATVSPLGVMTQEGQRRRLCIGLDFVSLSSRAKTRSTTDTHKDWLRNRGLLGQIWLLHHGLGRLTRSYV